MSPLLGERRLTSAMTASCGLGAPGIHVGRASASRRRPGSPAFSGRTRRPAERAEAARRREPATISARKPAGAGPRGASLAAHAVSCASRRVVATRTSSLARAAPEATAARAFSTPSAMLPAASAMYSAAPALSRTMSSCGPGSPSTTARSRSAFSAASPPARSSSRARAHAELLRRDLVALVEALAGEHLDHARGAGGRDLVEAVVAVHDEVAGVAHHAHRLGDAVHVARVGDADELVPRPRRVGQRTDEVERGRHAELAAHRRDVLHGQVVAGREHEADAALGDAAAHVLRGEVDVHAERLEHVGAAALAGRRAVAVLGDGDAGAGGDQRGRGGDVEGAGAVAAGAAGVEDDVGVHVDLLGQLAHGARHADDLLGRLALDAQRAEEGARLGLAGPAAHDLEQHGARVLLREVAPGGELRQRRAQDVIRHAASAGRTPARPRSSARHAGTSPAGPARPR